MKKVIIIGHILALPAENINRVPAFMLPTYYAYRSVFIESKNLPLMKAGNLE